MYIEILKSYSTNDEQKKLVNEIESSYKENPFFLAASDGKIFKSLKNEFEKSNNDRAVSLLESILESNHIYGRFMGRIERAESNVLRENLMKKNFVEFFNKEEKKYGKAPKVFFKFGGYHAAPHIDRFARISLGTFIEEWATVRNEKAFNLLMDANGGETFTSGQDGGDGNSTKPARSLVGVIDPNETDEDRKHVFADLLHNNNNIMLIDLRPLKKRLSKWKFLNRSARMLISSFDAYMAIPNVKPSTQIKIDNGRN